MIIALIISFEIIILFVISYKVRDMKKQKSKTKSPKNIKNLSKKNHKILNRFEEIYKPRLSSNTIRVYLRILKELLYGVCEVKSKSKHNQVKAVIKKAKDIDIDINYKLLDWSKKQDNAIEIKDKSIDSIKFQEIINLCPNSKKGKELKLAMKLSYYTGLRLNEVLSLQPSQINDNELEIIGKGNKFRLVYVPKKQKSLLDNFSEFTINDKYVNLTISRIADKLDKKDNSNKIVKGKIFSFHSLRHSFAINFIKSGGNVVLLQKLLGHASLNTTTVYLRFFKDKEALEKLGY